MAYARIVTRYRDDTQTEVEVGSYETPAYPDEVAEVTMRALALWRDAVGVEEET